MTASTLDPSSPPSSQWRARARKLDLRWLKLRRKLKRRLGVLDPLRIDAYIGFAGAGRAILRGRALEDELPTPPRPGDSIWDNLRRSLRQLESDEVPGLTLEVSFAGRRSTVVTDEEGYFFADLEVPDPISPGWHAWHVRALDPTFELSAGVSAEGALLVPSTGARFGVVSDIDDTILQSHVSHRLRQAYVTLLGNAITRLSYEDTQTLYRGLALAGRDAPFFYVSRSAWNIHAVLEHFIAHQGLPRGPLALRDVGLLNPPERRRGHKAREIERIFAMYPALPFVLIGDTGQRDAFIYMDLAQRYPSSVLAILIRDVSSRQRTQKVTEALRDGVPSPCLWKVFGHADEAVRFCRDHGLWSAAEPSASSEAHRDRL